MKKKFVYFVMLFCAIVLQTSVLPLFSSTYAIGDVVLMFVLAGAVIDGFPLFFSWSIFIGIIFDLVNYTTIGIHSIIFLLVVYFVSFFSRRFSIELKGVGMVLLVLFVVAATLISRTVMMLLIDFDMGMPLAHLQEIGNLKIISKQIISNLFLFFLCFIVFKKAKKFFAII